MKPTGTVEERPPQAPGPRVVVALSWTLRFGVAMFLFVGALQVMTTGARNLELLQHGGGLVSNAGSTFGLGWLGALLVLSGSPIAASSLTLVKSGSITTVEGFTMMTGSRLGAAFVVLAVAVVFALRGGTGERLKPVSTAVLALSTTAAIYLPGAAIGYLLLRWEPFLRVGDALRFPGAFTDLIALVYGDILDAIGGLPAPVLFLGGLGLLLVAFKVIDTVVPRMDAREIESRRLSWLTRKWPMFGLGCLVALVTMSVSVALTALVPLNAKGYVKREAMLPYIMGANITTLGDTLLAALLLDSGAAVAIVLAGIIGTTIVSLFLLGFLYPQTRTAVWRFHRKMVASKPRLAGFTAGLFAVPITIVALSGVVA